MASRQRRTQSRNEQISRSLSYVLRHGAQKENINIDNRGFVAIKELLLWKTLANLNATEEEILLEIQQNAKQRFALEVRTEGNFIRANQGHSLKTVEVDMQKIERADQIPMAVHGTYLRFWGSIAAQGLSRQTRQHIHLAQAEPNSNKVISGARSNVEILIYINLELALQDNIQFFLSENGVVLTEGIGGILEPKYFKKVINLKNNQILLEQ
eukprot:TRINITY_DN852_c0_g5_i1.p1 TRINITY_DN852_c0_g5~~TRINITY_DN852_c0_g5_i1.p1  ORF type:complete len:212 (-),score=109.97 TRINITY_DN852_c0_g5_i1:138-773(-)